MQKILGETDYYPDRYELYMALVLQTTKYS